MKAVDPETATLLRTQQLYICMTDDPVADLDDDRLLELFDAYSGSAETDLEQSVSLAEISFELEARGYDISYEDGLVVEDTSGGE